jgi:BON domain
VFVKEVMRRSAGVYLDAVREGTRLAWWGANFTLEQTQRLVGSGREPTPAMNDATLQAKVETELFRPADAPKGRVTIGVVDGVVELRGTAKTPKQIRDLERRAREIPEVRDVENLLHQPKTPAPTRTDAPAPKRKRTASSSAGRRVSGGARRPAPSTGTRATPTAENRPAVSTERPRPAASAPRPGPSTTERPPISGQRHTPGTGERPAPGGPRHTPDTPERPSPGGQRPAPGGPRHTPSTGEPLATSGERPTPSGEERRAPGTGARSSPSAEDRPAPGTGERPAPGIGTRPAPSTGERPTPGTGERATSASIRLRNVGAPGTAQSDPTHPRTKDVLGVLARQADSGDHMSDAEIGKELRLDVTEVADVLRTLSTLNLVSRTSTGDWELTPAGEREVEPGPPPKEPRVPSREPQAS